MNLSYNLNKSFIGSERSQRDDDRSANEIDLNEYNTDENKIEFSH